VLTSDSQIVFSGLAYCVEMCVCSVYESCFHLSRGKLNFCPVMNESKREKRPYVSALSFRCWEFNRNSINFISICPLAKYSRNDAIRYCVESSGRKRIKWRHYAFYIRLKSVAATTTIAMLSCCLHFCMDRWKVFKYKRIGRFILSYCYIILTDFNITRYRYEDNVIG